MSRERFRAVLPVLPVLVALVAGAAAASAASGPGAERPGASPRLKDDPKARAEWNALLRADANGVVSGTRRLEALERACTLPEDDSIRRRGGAGLARSAAGPSAPHAADALWQPIGPRPARSFEYQGFYDAGNVSGRITAFAIHPTKPDVMLLGAATGGIWRSEDGGESWTPVADAAPSLASSHIAFSPANPSIVYAATGETNSADLEFRPSRSLGTYLGAGVLRSVDGGLTWARVDTNLPAGAVVSRVVPHPTDPALVALGVYLVPDVATDRFTRGGFWLSTDGGVTFTKTFDHAVSDLVPDPARPDGLFAGFGITGGCDGCPKPSGVYRSADFGRTWTPVLAAGTSGATFAEQTANVKLAVAFTSPAVVYASVLGAEGDAHDGGGIYRSTDGGATFTKRSVSSCMCPAQASGSCFNQCSYDHFIAAVPSRGDVVWFGSIGLFRSTDGAATWKKVVDVYETGGSVHPDQHVGVVPPSRPDALLLANDGGLYETGDAGVSFTNRNDSLALAQFNGLALDPTDPLRAYGGTQDNGNLRFRGSYLWSDWTGGDGGFNLVKADAPRTVLAANYFAYLNLTTDGGDAVRDVTPVGTLMTPGGAPKEEMLFYPPAAAAPAAPGTVFIGTRRVWANTTFGAEPSRWEPRSTTTLAARISALGVVGDGGGAFWAGVTTGRVYFSTDGAATFTERSSGLPSTVVTKIVPVSADGRTVYVTFGGFTGSPGKHLFRTTDAGATWTNLSANLPDAPAIALALHPADRNDLYLATDIGVFRSRDAGATWASYNDGLPNTTITDLAFHPVSRDLVAATYGRGAFRVPAPGTAALPPLADFGATPAAPAPRQSVFFTDRSLGDAAAWSWQFGDGASSAERHPTHAYLQPGAYQARLTVTGAGGSATQTKTVIVTSGAASPVTLQVPVVLDAAGVPPSRFTSDLVLVNRSLQASRVTLAFQPAPGTPGANGPRVPESVGGGRELRLADVVAYLKGKRYAFPNDGSLVVGTLRVTFEDVSDPALVFAGSRTSTPNPNAAVGGRFGLFTPAVPVDRAANDALFVFGLREDAAFRSNLAVADVPPAAVSGGGASGFSIQVYDGETGFAMGAPETFTLEGAAWRQIGSILAPRNVRNGWAKVTKTGGGTSRFLAYGVVNDGPSTGGGTSDGSFVEALPVSAGGLPAIGESLVPIVLRVNSAGTLFTTELVLANPAAQSVSATLTYVPSAALSGDGVPRTGTVEIGAGRQLRKSDAIAFLRDELRMALPGNDVAQGGALFVSGAVAVARTFNPNPDAAVGGTFGLAYGGVPASAWAASETWVYGLVQDGGTRTNLALVDARRTGSGSVTYLVDLFDAASGDGSVPKSTLTLALGPGQWSQLNRVLDTAGVSHGYARIRPQGGTSAFVAYAVLNDGANPGQRTSDGSYVPMAAAR